MAFPPAFLDELRARVGLVQVISRKVKLQKAGREWKGCCPFHNEKTPSFYVNEDKGFYHCFGCGAHGDVIRFVVEQEGLRFPEAVRSLAAEAGLQVPEDSPETRERERERQGLHDITGAAAQWFREQLNGISGANARRYVAERGLTPETGERFGLGYAPDGNRLKAALKGAGEDKLLEVGLIGHAEERDETYDRFRNRLIFPIRDPRGRVVGFGGRVLGDGQPKYLNSPDTPLFDKGRLLYNLDQAGPAARKSGRLFVVEGYLDVIALAQAGIPEAVAPLGTALTEQQLQLLWRVVPEPVLCFDGDKAGRAAAVRATRRALPLLQPGCSLSILTLPAGQDPDDLVKAAGGAGFLKLAEGALPLHEFIWNSVVEAGDSSTPERRIAIKEALHEHAAEIGNADIRAQYELIFRERFWQAFGWRRSATGAPAPVTSMPIPLPKTLRNETQAIIVGLLRFPDIAGDHADDVAALPFQTKRDVQLRNAILDAVAWQPHLDSETLDHTLAAAGLREAVDEVRASSPLQYSFTSAASPPERARKMLIVNIKKLAALYENYIERRRLSRRLKEIQSEEGSDAALEAECADILARRREAEAERRRLYDELYEFGQEIGPDETMKIRLLKGQDRVGELDGEDHGSSHGHLGDEGGRRRASA